MSAQQNMGHTRLANILVILVPLIMILLSVFLVLYTANIWAPIEYRRPSFPDDPYGFTLEDRLYWSSVDIDFLLMNEDISYFEAFSLEDGSPMHNERELRHMQDVQDLLNLAKFTLIGAVLLGVAIVIFLWNSGSQLVAAEALLRGARWTLIFIVILVIGIAVAFGVIFVGFHQIFFESETWRFAYSDTFIRLYPERFWRDCFILLAAVTMVEVGLVYFGSRRLVGKLA